MIVEAKTGIVEEEPTTTPLSEERKLEVSSDIHNAFIERGLEDHKPAIDVTTANIVSYLEGPLSEAHANPPALGKDWINIQVIKMITDTAVAAVGASRDAELSSQIKRAEPKS